MTAKIVPSYNKLFLSANPPPLHFQVFRSSVLDIVAQYDGVYENSLEEYLRALWATIQTHQHEPASYPLFCSLIAEAFETDPCPFETQWLEYGRASFWAYEGGVYVIKEFKDEHWTVAKTNVDDREILTDIILQQIADLHRMKGDQLRDPHRYLGIDSPTGNRWYNFDVFTYWECAIGGMEDHLRSNRSLLAERFSVCTWATLAALLELGQMHE